MFNPHHQENRKPAKESAGAQLRPRLYFHSESYAHANTNAHISGDKDLKFLSEGDVLRTTNMLGDIFNSLKNYLICSSKKSPKNKAMLSVSINET